MKSSGVRVRALLFIVLAATGLLAPPAVAATPSLAQGNNSNVRLGIAVDSAGKAHIATHLEQPVPGLYYLTNASGSWTARPISTTGYEGFARIAVDSAGKVHIAWADTYAPYPGVYYATNKSGGWVVDQLARDPDVLYGVSLAVDAGGWIHLTWNRWYLTNRAGSITVRQLFAGVASTAEIAVSSTGGVHAVARADPLTLVYVTSEGGTWQAPKTFTGHSYNNPWIGVDSLGKAHIVYQTNTAALWNLTNAGGSWATTLLIQINANQQPYGVAFSPSGAAHVGYVDYGNSTDSTMDIFTVRSDANPIVRQRAVDRTSTNAPTPAIALIGAATEHLAYLDPDLGLDVLAGTNSGGTWAFSPGPYPVIGSPAPISIPWSVPKLGAQLASDGRVPVDTQWFPSSPDVVGYDVQRKTDTSAFAAAGSPASPPLNQLAAPGHLYQYRARARYGSSTTSAWVNGAASTLRRPQETSTRFTYGGSWTRSAVSGASGGHVKSSSQAGAWVRITTTARSIGLVAKMGPGYGRALVYIDGVFFGYADLYRGTASTRRIAWSTRFLDSRSRTIKFVVEATSGRPKLNMDAVVLFE